MPMPHRKYRPYETVVLPDRRWPDVVLSSAPIWCSTDLRDGNQALVNPMDAARKRRFFELLIPDVIRAEIAPFEATLGAERGRLREARDARIAAREADRTARIQQERP